MKRSVLFLGDSITDSDRLWKSEYAGLGDGYVYETSLLLKQDDPELRAINKGVAGFTVNRCLSALESGSLPLPDLNPAADLIVLMIGINDCGVMMNTGSSLKQQRFSLTYEALLRKLKPLCRQVLCFGPFIFPFPEEYRTWIPVIREAEQIQSFLCRKENIPFFSLYEYFHVQCISHPVSELSIDGIHLTSTGHMLLADYLYPLLKAEL